MLALALAVVVAAALVAIGSLVLKGPRPGDEVERFHRARQMTTEWARAGVTQPFLAQELLDEADQPTDRSHVDV